MVTNIDMGTNQYGAIPIPQNLNPYSQMSQTIVSVPPHEKPNVDKFMRDFNNRNREKFNPYWFQRRDEDLIDGMKRVILSCQRDKYFVLKVVKFDVITDYEEVNRTLYNYYSTKTKNGKKIDNDYENINLRDSDIMLLKITYYIKLNIPDNKIRIDTKTGEPETTEGQVEVLVALPIYVDKYYFRILGNYYIPIFQIVDGSTYNNTTSNSKALTITLKTQFMPIKVYKEYHDIIDCVDKDVYRSVLFTSYIFSKKADAMKFILGRYGYYGAMEMLGLTGIYLGHGHMHDRFAGYADPNMFYNFEDKSGKVCICVYKHLFNKDNMTQSFVNTIIRGIKKVESYNELLDPRYWTRALGADFQSATLDKGIPVLDSFESIYDLETKEAIRLPLEDKADSYCILRWMMREFNYLKARDNIDISTKHPRKADEYLPAIYAKKISTGIYRISDRGKNVTFKDVVRVINTAPDFILKSINSANLVDYVDLVNDNDAELALSYTYKGISGLGDQGTGTAVPLIYRSVHPSHLGKVDLDSSSASDPGLSGVICPMAKVYDGSFSDFVEPNGWSEFYSDTLSELKSMNGIIEAIEFRKKLGLAYDYVKEDMVRETIQTYNRLIPAIIDLDGKKDYTIGTVFPESSGDILINKGNNDLDNSGDITASEEDVPSDL